MTHELVVDRDWREIVERLGGDAALEASARETKAFRRARVIDGAVCLLRLILAYCLSQRGLRSTAAWATSMGLVDVSNVALLYRLRRCGDWLAVLIGRALTASAPRGSHGRLIRVIDATTVPKAGTLAKRKNGLWRVHGAFDVPSERFGFFELTDQRGGETLDRVPVVTGEIRIADRAYLQPDRMAAVLDADADIIVRAGWRNARWLDAAGAPVDPLAEFHAVSGRIDRPIWLARSLGSPLGLRLVAVKKTEPAAAAAKRKARRAARKGGHHISKGTLAAAGWVLLITSLKPEAFPTADVLALDRLRWRIELGFKRLKSLIGLKGPPGRDERSARPYVLAHLLMILLLEPLVDAFEDSPRLAAARHGRPLGASCASWSPHFVKPSSPSQPSPAFNAARHRCKDISGSHPDDDAVKN